MVDYNPHNINQMYEQYSKSHSSSSSSNNSGSTYDEVPQTITQGLGSPLSSSFNKPYNEDNNDTGGVQSFLENAWSWLSASGGEPEKPKVYDGSSVYDRSEFDPARYTKPINLSDQDKRINDMLNNRDDDPGYKDDEYAGSTYDEVEDQDIPAKAPVTIKDAINTAIDNTIATGTYTIQKGDTLSEIAAATGKTVIELKQLNDIQNPRKMQAGATLKIPVQTAQDKEVVEGAKSMSDLKPIKLASQSGVPMEDREFFPEDTSDLNNPQTRQGLMTRSDTANINNPQTRDGISFISTPAIDNIYNEIGAVETTTAHLGEADYENQGITLGYGIVPTSGLKYEHNGTVIELPESTAQRWSTLSAAGVTRANFNADNVITDDVVKDGIRRDRYDTDESFTKAVMKQFQDRVENAAERNGVDADDIPEGAMTGLVGYSFNTGVSHNYNQMRPVYAEIVSGDDANMTTVQTGMLQVFTENGIVKQGIANRRRTDYNHVAEALGKPTITHKTNRQLPNGNAGFEFEFSDGTTRTFDSGKRYDTETSQDDFKDDLDVKQAVN